MIYIGIDIAKRKFDYCIIDSELNKIKTGIIINNYDGFKQFLSIVNSYDNIRMGMESTNIYHVNLYSYLIENSYNPILLNPIETKLLKSSRIRKNKTDRIDSEAIARYIIIYRNNTISMENQYDDLKEYINTYIRISRKITAVKNQLIRDMDLLYPGLSSTVNIDSGYFTDTINNIDDIINNKFRIKHISMEKYDEIRNIIIKGNNSNNAVKYDIKINIEAIELLNRQLNNTRKIIEEEYNKIDSRIKTIPGMGTITGSIMLSSIGDINRFDSIVKLRAYAGMDPMTRQSGDYNITSHISKRGNPLMRYALYLSTVSAIRFNPVIRRYYNYKKDNGMSGNKLIVACSNKLLNIIYSVMKNNVDFKDPEELVN